MSKRYIDVDDLIGRMHFIEFADGQDRSLVYALIDMQPTADVVEVVRCKDCKHRPIDKTGHNYGQDLKFPDDVCPCQNFGDHWYSWMPDDDWFCPNGERKETDG